MGLTYVEGVPTGPTGKTATLRFLVDSGATYSLVDMRADIVQPAPRKQDQNA
jgi:hypothetical protein